MGDDEPGGDGGDGGQRTIHDIQDEIQARQQEITELQHALLNGEIQPDDYQSRYEKLLEEIHELEEEAHGMGF